MLKDKPKLIRDKVVTIKSNLFQLSLKYCLSKAISLIPASIANNKVKNAFI